MTKILINGDFLCRRLTGIERYAYEITMRLDAMIGKNEIAILIPANTQNIPAYKNLNVIRHKDPIKSHLLWQMIKIQFFLLQNRQYIILDFGNTCLPLRPGIVFLHDIYCEFYPKDFTTMRDKIIRLYNKWQYRLIAKKAKRIATVSEFSKNQIAQTYHINPNRIQVIYSSWNHFKTIQADASIFKEHPELEKNEFYFSLGSLSKRKNIRWIIEYAAKHLETLFAISGDPLNCAREQNIKSGEKNVIFLGYIDDAKVRALMERCKAFILPSYYEGFGLTPLEALSCGANIVVANAASLPEIYGECAHYINPFDTDVDLDALVKEPVEKCDAILEKYSYDASAKKVYELCLDYTRESDTN